MKDTAYDQTKSATDGRSRRQLMLISGLLVLTVVLVAVIIANLPKQGGPVTWEEPYEYKPPTATFVETMPGPEPEPVAAKPIGITDSSDDIDLSLSMSGSDYGPLLADNVYFDTLDTLPFPDPVIQQHAPRQTQPSRAHSPSRASAHVASVKPKSGYRHRNAIPKPATGISGGGQRASSATAPEPIIVADAVPDIAPEKIHVAKAYDPEPLSSSRPEPANPVVIATSDNAPTGDSEGSSLPNGSAEKDDWTSPGNSPGTEHVSGDFDLNGGTLLFEILGTTAGLEYDQIIVDGIANLNEGNVVFAFIDNFIPDPTDIFDLLLADQIIIDFDNVDFYFGLFNPVDDPSYDLHAPQNLSFYNGFDPLDAVTDDVSIFLTDTLMSISYEDLGGATNPGPNETFTAFSIPEPGSLLLLVPGLMLLGMFTRRRQASIAA